MRLLIWVWACVQVFLALSIVIGTIQFGVACSQVGMRNVLMRIWDPPKTEVTK